MTRPLTPEQKEKYRKMDEQLKEAALFAENLQVRMLALAKQRLRVNDDEGASRKIRVLTDEELALRLKKYVPQDESSKNPVAAVLPSQQTEKTQSSETRYTWSKKPNLRQFTQENAVKAIIRQSPIYQNPVVKSIRAALGVVNSDVLKLKPFNH